MSREEETNARGDVGVARGGLYGRLVDEEHRPVNGLAHDINQLNWVAAAKGSAILRSPRLAQRSSATARPAMARPGPCS